jgi:hypothetical protein
MACVNFVSAEHALGAKGAGPDVSSLTALRRRESV